MWWRRLAEVQTEHQNGEERGFKWLNVEWLLVPDGLVWVFQKLLIYWDFHAQSSLGFTENCPKNRKYPVSSSCGPKCLEVRRMGRLVRDDRKATVTQITFGMWWNGRFASWMCSRQICSNCVMLSCQYRPKSLSNVSNTLFNLCRGELGQFWKQKGVQPSTSKV